MHPNPSSIRHGNDPRFNRAGICYQVGNRHQGVFLPSAISRAGSKSPSPSIVATIIIWFHHTVTLRRLVSRIPHLDNAALQYDVYHLPILGSSHVSDFT